VKVPADLERVVMRALEREAPLRQGSADELMAGFGVDDRVGVILGGKFVDPGHLLSNLVVRALRLEPDHPTLLSISGAPGAGKSEILDQLNLACVTAGARCIHLVAGGRISFSSALAAELDGACANGETHLKSPADLVAAIRKIATSQRVAILLDTDERGSHADIAEARALAQQLYASSVEHGVAIGAVVVVAEVGEAEPEVFSTQTRIPEFDEAGTMELTTGLLGSVDIARGGSHALHRATGGNPASLHALLFDLMSHGDLDRVEGRWKLGEVGRVGEGASPTLESRWRLRWQGLPLELQDVLGALALVSGVDVADVSGFERATSVSGAVATLQAGGWLKAVTRRMQLVSEGLREIVLRELDDVRRRKLALRLLDSGITTDKPSVIALKLLAKPSRETVTASLEVARAAMAARDLFPARTLLLECARHESLFSNERDRAGLHLMLAEVFLGAGDLALADQHVRDANVTATASRDAAISAKAHWLLGTIAGRAGRVADARRELEQAMGSAQDAGEPLIRLRSLAAYAELSWTHGNDLERKAAIELVERALAKESFTGDREEERGRLVYGVGAAHVRTGQSEKAVSILETELPRITSPYWGARAANALGTACFYLGRYDQALSCFGRGLERLQDGDAPEIRARIHANRGACLNAMGRIREALDDNERALVLSRRAGSGYDTVAAAAGIAIDLYYLGRYDDVIAKAREVRSLAARIGSVVYEFKGYELEGFALLAIGDLEGAGQALQLADGLPQDYDPVRTLPRIERLRARLFMARGKREEALAALQRAMELLKDQNDLEDLWGVEIELALLNQTESRDTGRTLTSIAAKARTAKNIVVEVSAAAAIAEILSNGWKGEAELLHAMKLGLARAEEGGFVEQAARISVGIGGALIDAGDVRAGQSRMVQAQRLLLQLATELSPSSRHLFVRSPHIAPALAEIGRRLSQSPR